MSNVFLVFRGATFALTCLLALIALAVAVSGTHSVIGLVYHLAGLAIATPVLTLISLPTLLAISRYDHRVELISLVLLWLFWLSVGADSVAVKFILYPTGCKSIAIGLSSSDCNELGVVAAFALLIWIILTAYFIVLTVQFIGLPTYSSITSVLRTTVTRLLNHTRTHIPRSKSSESACLMCRKHPKNGRFDFCGTECRDEARNISPLLLEVPPGHTTFEMVEHKFRESWKAGALCPRVKHVYRVVESSTSLESYYTHLRTYGNECFRYHGTQRSCRLGDNGHTKLCPSPFCNACSIIRTSFEVSLANPGGAFGQGIYTSSASNKSASYTTSGVLFMTKVVLGNVHNVSAFAEVQSCPSGSQSVVFDRMNGTLNETVVYTNDAIRPVFLILLGS